MRVHESFSNLYCGGHGKSRGDFRRVGTIWRPSTLSIASRNPSAKLGREIRG
jgi:hypothetical protein